LIRLRRKTWDPKNIKLTLQLKVRRTEIHGTFENNEVFASQHICHNPPTQHDLPFRFGNRTARRSVPDRHRLNFELLNPDECDQKYHF
jgi:hypothetical protein